MEPAASPFAEALELPEITFGQSGHIIKAALAQHLDKALVVGHSPLDVSGFKFLRPLSGTPILFLGESMPHPNRIHIVPDPLKLRIKLAEDSTFMYAISERSRKEDVLLR